MTGINEKPKVAFICVHNSCRSQIAEALGKHVAKGVFDSYSAGTETKDRINQDAVRLMKKRTVLIWNVNKCQSYLAIFHPSISL